MSKLQESAGIYVEIDITLRNALSAYCKSNGHTQRWCIEEGLRRVVLGGDHEYVALCVKGKMYTVPREIAEEYELVVNTQQNIVRT